MDRDPAFLPLLSHSQSDGPKLDHEIQIARTVASKSRFILAINTNMAVWTDSKLQGTENFAGLPTDTIIEQPHHELCALKNTKGSNCETQEAVLFPNVIEALVARIFLFSQLFSPPTNMRFIVSDLTEIKGRVTAIPTKLEPEASLVLVYKYKH